MARNKTQFAVESAIIRGFADGAVNGLGVGAGRLSMFDDHIEMQFEGVFRVDKLAEMIVERLRNEGLAL